MARAVSMGSVQGSLARLEDVTGCRGARDAPEEYLLLLGHYLHAWIGVYNDIGV